MRCHVWIALTLICQVTQLSSIGSASALIPERQGNVVDGDDEKFMLDMNHLEAIEAILLSAATARNSVMWRIPLLSHFPTFW
jgi:hypothetical protein